MLNKKDGKKILTLLNRLLKSLDNCIYLMESQKDMLIGQQEDAND